jgi:hypothetical protein
LLLNIKAILRSIVIDRNEFITIYPSVQVVDLCLQIRREPVINDEYFDQFRLVEYTEDGISTPGQKVTVPESSSSKYFPYTRILKELYRIQVENHSNYQKIDLIYVVCIRKQNRNQPYPRKNL